MAITTQRNFQGMNKSVEATRDAMQAETKAANDAATATGRSGTIAATAAEGFDDLAESAEGAQTQMQLLDEMFGTFDKNVAAIRARDAANLYMKDMGENLGKVAKNLMGESKAAIANRDVVLEAFSKKQAELKTWADATDASADEVEARWQEMTKEVYDALVENGIDAKQLREFLGEKHINIASVRVSNEMEGAMRYIGSNVGAEAKHQGTYIGREMTNGLIAGINAGIPPMERAASAGARAAENAFKRSADIRSPSRVFEKLGQALTDGIVKGMKSGRDDLAEAGMEAFTSWFDDVERELAANRDRIVALYDGMADSVRSSVLGALDFGAAAPEFTDEGERIGLNFTSALQEQADKARHFAERVKQLVAQGLSPTALKMVLDAGVDAGTRIADELIHGGSEAIYVTNELVNSTISAAEKIAKDTADAFYGTGVQEAQNTYEGFKANFGSGGPAYNAMQNLMTRLAKSMERTTTITVRVVRQESTQILDEFGGPRALGGPVAAGTAYLVGEKGPELFVSDRAGQIIPNMDLGSRNIPITSGRSGGGNITNVNVNVNAGMGADGADVGRKVVEAIRKYERRSGPVFVSA
jgi:hypothetical protein